MRFLPRQLLTAAQLNALSDAANFTPPTAPAPRAVAAKAAEQAATPGDYADAAALALGAARDVAEHAGERLFRGPDGTVQFSVGWTQGGTERWHAVAGGAGHGATFAVLSDAADADGSFVAKGKGDLAFGNGVGLLAMVSDNGTGERPANQPRLRAGSAGKPAVYTAFSWGGEANVGLALIPLGNGAITANIPDNAVTGGNPRGQYAVDLQRTRSSPTHVAGGSYSANLGGDSNTASSIGAANLGGTLNTAGGPYSSTIGGTRGSTGGIHAKVAHASGRFAADGDAQQGWNELRGQSTSATPVRLTADGAAASTINCFNLPNNSSMRIKGSWIASQSGGTAGTVGDTAGGDWAITVKRYGAAAQTFKVANATVTKEADAAAAAWTFAMDVDTAVGGLAATFTGEANKTIKAVAVIHSAEVIR